MLSVNYPRSRLVLAAVLCALVAGLGGCLGPTGIRRTRTLYNEAILRTNDEELLLNLVRLRYGESPSFLTVTGVTAQFEVDAGAVYRNGWDRGPIYSNYLDGNLGFADRPTVTLAPQRSAAFTRALLSHISLETLYLFGTTNTGVDVLLRVFVREVNGLALTAGDPQVVEARRIADLMRVLQQQRTMVLGTDYRQSDVPDAPPFESLNAEELVKIKQAGYGVRSLGEKKGYVLTRTTPVRVLRIQPDAALSPEVLELERLLRLQPGLTSYELEAAPEGQLRPSDPPEQRTHITLTTRSVLEVMFLLSQAVAVPEEHLCKGSAAVACDPDGASLDGGHVLADLFHVGVAKRKPKAAAVAVKYRGYWYYIDDADAASKSTLRLFTELFRLERISDPEGAPLLTLPVGR
jgi:hypothetical protein